MKKLPVFFFSFLLILQFFFLTPRVLAEQTISSVTPIPLEGSWTQEGDPEVTFIGRMAARSNDFIDWMLSENGYKWMPEGITGNPLTSFWVTLRNIVYSFLALFVLATAFLMIIRRGKDVTVIKSIPRFILIILLVTFSFAVVQFLYQITDIIQGFFIRGLSSKNLLSVAFKYQDFVGFKRVDAVSEEAAFISLFLTKATAITYYVMGGILIIRKIILWFFVIISPLLPLLFFYSPIRNTAKLWVGEFFRWLLYAPIFAILLKGLVDVWRSGFIAGLNFLQNDPARTYQTAVNILLGAPGQTVSFENNINNPNTFAQYILALLMLWVVMLLPFILLRIFLDYLFNLQIKDYGIIKQLSNNGLPLFSKYGFSKPLPSAPPPNSPYQSTGAARALPFSDKISMPKFADQTLTKNLEAQQLAQKTAEILRSTNLNLPTMRDIAKYDIAMRSNDLLRQKGVTKAYEVLGKIASPTDISSVFEKERFNSLRTDLNREKQEGNNIASSILSAAEIVNRNREVVQMGDKLSQMTNPSTLIVPEERKNLDQLREMLKQEKEKGNPLATTILSTINNLSQVNVSQETKVDLTNSLINNLKQEKEKGNPLASTVLSNIGAHEVKTAAGTPLPVSNRVQTVSIEDYETVKKMWQENYQKQESPQTIEGLQKDKKVWLKEDIDKINQTINLLYSSDPTKVNQGLEMVANILPFLLIGGFSQNEVISYLKAKQEAAKSSLEEITKKEEEEETKIGVVKKEEEEEKEMTASVEKEISEEKNILEERTPVNNNNNSAKF